VSLKDDITSAIEVWLQSRRGATLLMLSKLSGVSYTTLQRVAQGEVEPSLKVVMLLLPVIMPKEKEGDRASKLLLEHFPETGYWIKAADDAGIEPLPEVGLLENFSREDFIVLSMGATSLGTTKERILAKLGEKAQESLDKLLAAGVLLEDNGRVVASKKKFRVLGHEKVLREIGWLAEMFDFKLLDKWGSMYSIKTEGLSDEALKKGQRIMIDASDKLTELFSDPSNHGENVMGYALFSTFIDASKGGES